LVRQPRAGSTAAEEGAAMRPRRVRPWLVGGLPALALLLAAGALVVPACAGAVRTARLLPAFFAGLPVDPSAWLARGVTYEVVELQGGTDYERLHVWRPASGRYPALVVSLGVDPAPPDDRRVVRLFRGLARAGLVAVLVQSAALDQDRLTPAAPDLIVRAFRWTAAAPAVREGRVGLMGFSVGAALVEIAAADPRIRDRVVLVEGFGGYTRLADVVAAATTGTITYQGRHEPWQPDPLTVSVVRKNLIAGVPSAGDREALTRALVDGDGHPPAPESLTAPGRAVLAVLTNTDPARVAELLAELPIAQREELEALSPAGVLAQIRAPVYLMHDRGDELIPYVESRRARDLLTAAGNPPYYSEFDIFRHVEPGRGGSPSILLRDGVRLFLHAYWVLRRLE
jgi:hypothetical protein